MKDAPRKYQGTLVRPVGRPPVPFYVVPEPVFLSKKLSSDSRLVVGWLCGKPPHWSACVSEICRSLNLSEKVWQRVKKELKAEGVIPQDHPRLVKGGIGGFIWLMDVDLKMFYR